MLRNYRLTLSPGQKKKGGARSCPLRRRSKPTAWFASGIALSLLTSPTFGLPVSGLFWNHHYAACASGEARHYRTDNSTSNAAQGEIAYRDGFCVHNSGTVVDFMACVDERHTNPDASKPFSC